MHYQGTISGALPSLVKRQLEALFSAENLYTEHDIQRRAQAAGLIAARPNGHTRIGGSRRIILTAPGSRRVLMRFAEPPPKVPQCRNRQCNYLDEEPVLGYRTWLCPRCGTRNDLDKEIGSL